MAKPKKYISSKLKVKRKFVLGGDTEQELYLNGNTTYQAVDLPTAMLQHQFDANEQLKAKQNTAIFGNQMARQMDYLQDLNADIEKRKKAEETARQQQAEADKQAVNQQVTQTAGKAGKQIAKDYKAGLFNTVTPVASNYYSPTWAPTTPAPVAPVGPAPVMIDPALQATTSTTGELFAGAPTVGQNLATTTTTSGFGQTAAAIGKSVGGAALVAAPAIVGQIASNQLNKADDRQMKREGRSQYYDDTEYSRKEFNAQMLKSTGKGATIGGTIGSAIPIPGVGTGLGMAIGAGIGAGVGAIKATHQRRMTKDENERGVKIGNKRFGKKLLFGEENVYDENLDPTVIEKRNREAQLKAMTETANAMDNATLSSMTQYDTNTGFNVARYGGKIEYLQGGIAKPLPRGAKEYIGKSHEEGGIDLPNNIEVEGGETEQNNYIFSKHLKLPTGISYAQAHKNLLKSGASSEEIKQLALSQEAAAGRNPNEIKTMKFAKYGGPLKYEDGGNTETDPPKKGEGELDFDTKTKMRIHANEGIGPKGLTVPYLDSKGYWTVGYGHLLTKADGTPYTKKDKLPAQFNNITKQQVENWAKSDYDTLKQVAINWIGEDQWKQLPDSVKSGIVELAYGLGPSKLAGFVNTKKYILEGDYESAAENITNSKYFKDVKERRGTQVAALIGGNEEVFNSSATNNQYTVPKTVATAYFKPGKQLNSTTNTKPTNTSNTSNTSKYPTASRYQIPGPHGMMISSDDGISPNAEGMKQIEATARIKAEQDENLFNWGMGALTGIYGGARALVTGAAKKAGQYIDDAMSEEEAASNAAQNASGARSSSTAVQRTGVPYRNEPLNTNLAEFKPFGQNTGLATEGQWMADANAVSAETPGFRIDYGNTAVGPYRGPQYINITGRTVTDPRAQIGLGLDILKPSLTNSITNISTYKPGTFLAEQKRKAEENKKPEDQTVTEPELSEDPTTGTADTSGLKDKFTLPKISAGPFNRPEYPVKSAEEVQKTKEKYDLSKLPADKKDYTGLLNIAPAIAASMVPNFKTVTPSLIPTASAGPGAIGRVTLNRETDRQLLAENQRTAAAMTEAASMAGGPGGLAAMGRAQLLKSDADLKASGMVAAKNAEINAREASINAGISGQNLALANQYENRRMQTAAMNANILNTTNQLNTDIKNKEKYLKYATGVEAVQSGVENYLGYKKDQDTFKRDKDVAMALDAYHTLERKDIEKKLTEASQDKNSKYYGTDPVTVRKMARQYIEEAYPDQMKLGGKKYVSRLGDLVNKRNKRF